MPVSKRGDVWAYSFDLPGSSREHRQRVRASGFATRREAAEAERARRNELDRGRDSSITLRQLILRYLDHAKERLAPASLEAREFALGKLPAALLDREARGITTLDLHDLWRHLATEGGHDQDGVIRPLSPATVRMIVALVSSAYRYGIQRDLLTRNPVAYSDPPTAPRHPARALSLAQLRSLIASAPTPTLAALIELAASTGARRGELLALRWSDLRGGVVRIQRSLCEHTGQDAPTKTRQVRDVVLPTSAIAALSAHRERQELVRVAMGPAYEGDRIFAGERGQALAPKSVQQAFRNLTKRLGIAASFHSLRHTHASHLIAAGVPLTDVAQRLGHSSMATTATTYAHAIQGAQQAAADAWERIAVVTCGHMDRVTH